jgi:hypothetical protein
MKRPASINRPPPPLHEERMTVDAARADIGFSPSPTPERRHHLHRDGRLHSVGGSPRALDLRPGRVFGNVP